MIVRAIFVVVATLVLSQTVQAIPILSPEPDDRSPRKESLLEVGLRHFQAGDLTSAENALRGELRVNPDSVDTMMWLTEVLFRQGDIDGAGAQLSQIISLQPGHAPAHHAMSRFHYIKNKFADSERSLLKAIELDPQLFAAHIDLADQQLLVHNNVPKAIEAYRAAVALDPNHAGAHYGLGVAQNRAGKHTDAENAWRLAAKLDSKNPLPMYALGSMLMNQRKLDGALDAFARALQAEPRHVESLLARGQIFAARGDSSAALNEFNAVLAIVPEHPLAYLKIGLLRQQQGNKRSAIKAYRRAVEIDSQQALAHNNLAWLLAERERDRDLALRHARLATVAQPRVGAYWDTLGWIQHQLGDNEAALKSLTKATQLQRQPAAFEHLAKVHTVLGNTAEANKADEIARSLAN